MTRMVGLGKSDIQRKNSVDPVKVKKDCWLSAS
jgi:hypothetical protein